MEKPRKRIGILAIMTLVTTLLAGCCGGKDSVDKSDKELRELARKISKDCKATVVYRNSSHVTDDSVEVINGDSTCVCDGSILGALGDYVSCSTWLYDDSKVIRHGMIHYEFYCSGDGVCASYGGVVGEYRASDNTTYSFSQRYPEKK